MTVNETSTSSKTSSRLTGEFSVPMGELSELVVEVNLGVTKLVVFEGNDSGAAAAGNYVTHENLPIEVDYTTEGAKGILTIRQKTQDHFRFGGFFGSDASDLRLNLSVAQSLPVRFSVKQGVGSVELDLEKLDVKSLKLRGGVGKSNITLPRTGTLEKIDIKGGVGEITIERPLEVSELAVGKIAVAGGVGSISMELPASGSYSASFESGLGSISLDLPKGLETQISIARGLGSISFDAAQFSGATGTAHYQSPGYAEAANRADITIKSGMGSISITGS